MMWGYFGLSAAADYDLSRVLTKACLCQLQMVLRLCDVWNFSMGIGNINARVPIGGGW